MVSIATNLRFVAARDLAREKSLEHGVTVYLYWVGTGNLRYQITSTQPTKPNLSYYRVEGETVTFVPARMVVP